MDFKTEFIPMQIKFDFINGFGESCVSGEWIESQCNMRPCEEFNGWLEVTCCSAPNDKLSSNLLFDLDIENHLKCGPVASRSRSNVYGLFWKIGVKRCKLYFAFEDEAIYRNYTAYLENVLRSLEDYQSEHEDVNMCPSQSTDVIIESGNTTQDMSPMPVIVDAGLLTESVRVSDASGICHEVQLRRRTQKKNRRVQRPIGITGDLFMAKRTRFLSSAPTLPPKNDKSVDDFKIQTPSKNPKSPSFWNRVCKEKGSHDSNFMTESVLRRKINDELEEDADQDFGRYLHLHPFNTNFDLNLNDVTSAGTDLAKRSEENTRVTGKKNNSVNTSETKRSCVPESRLWSHNLCDGDVIEKYLSGAHVNIEQSRSEIFMEEDYHRSAFAKSALAPTFITFGKVAEVDENGYATVRERITDHNCQSDDQSISGCSSGEDRISQLSLKKLQFSDTDLLDDAISLNPNSPSSSTTNSHRNSIESCSRSKQCNFMLSGVDIDFSLKNAQKASMPHKINNGFNRTKSRIIALDEIFFESSCPTDIHRPIVILPDPPTLSSETDINRDCGSHIPSGNAAQSTNQTKFTARTLLHDIMKSRTKQFLRACADIRELTMSLIILPRTMQNFL